MGGRREGEGEGREVEGGREGERERERDEEDWSQYQALFFQMRFLLSSVHSQAIRGLQ